MFVTFLHSFFLAIFRLSFGMRSVLQSWCPLMRFLLFSIPFSPQVAVAAWNGKQRPCARPLAPDLAWLLMLHRLQPRLEQSPFHRTKSSDIYHVRKHNLYNLYNLYNYDKLYLPISISISISMYVDIHICIYCICAYYYTIRTHTYTYLHLCSPQ